MARPMGVLSAANRRLLALVALVSPRLRRDDPPSASLHERGITHSMRTNTLTPLVTRYIGERLRRNEITRLTARSIRNHLDQFAHSFADRPLSQLGPKAVERWLAESGGYAPTTRASRLSSLRGFARWMVLGDIIVKDFTISTPRIRLPRRAPRDMTEIDARRILDVCSTDRERLIIWLMFGAGLRCVEVSRLTVDDWDAGAGLLHVTGKACHERQVPLGRPIRSAIQTYLAQHPSPGGPLVQREDGQPGFVGPERISGLVGRLVRKAGVKQRNYDGRSAHGLRACAASDLADVCPDPRIVAEFLGHNGLGNLSRYLRRQQLGKVREAVEARWSA